MVYLRCTELPVMVSQQSSICAPPSQFSGLDSCEQRNIFSRPQVSSKITSLLFDFEGQAESCWWPLSPDRHLDITRVPNGAFRKLGLGAHDVSTTIRWGGDERLPFHTDGTRCLEHRLRHLSISLMHITVVPKGWCVKCNNIVSIVTLSPGTRSITTRRTKQAR